MKYVAYILFAGGIMLAISGAARLPPERPAAAVDVPFAAKFPDTLPEFTAGMMATVIGLVLWWRDVFAQRAVSSADERDSSNPLVLLQGLIPQLRALGKEIDKLDWEDITQRVEHLLEHTVLPFAEGRQKLFDRLGMSVGAEVLVTAAYGERMLNRTWSAAADLHLPESRSSFHEAVAAFEDAARIGGVAAD